MCFSRKWVRFHAVLEVRQIIIINGKGGEGSCCAKKGNRESCRLLVPRNSNWGKCLSKTNRHLTTLPCGHFVRAIAIENFFSNKPFVLADKKSEPQRETRGDRKTRACEILSNNQAANSSMWMVSLDQFSGSRFNPSIRRS